MRFDIFLTAVLMAILLIGAGVFLLPAYAGVKQEKIKLQESVDNLQRCNQELEKVKLQTDELRTSPIAVERVAREKFGLCREGEKIFHFEKPVATTNTSSAGSAPVQGERDR
ncbi:MAG: septum formation initiator family protein [Lentisphaeria bacterium]|nr:septum formation initiator family protein [Lentisphaeria bacterium]